MEPRCYRCGSLNHSTEEHMRRLAEGRRKSAKWRAAVSQANTLLKTGKPLVFADPEGRSERLSQSLNQPEVRAKLTEARKRNWSGRTDEQKAAIAEKISKAQKGRKFSEEHLANLRKANAQPRSNEHRRKLASGRKGKSSWNKGLTKFTNASVMSASAKLVGRIPDYNKYRAHYDGPKGKYLMRSRWEVAYAEWMDERNIDWQYEPRWFNIGRTTYTPDFYLPTEDRYIEIKGRMTDKDAEKLRKFAERYPHIGLTVLQRAELTAIGLLDKHNRLVKCGT